MIRWQRLGKIGKWVFMLLALTGLFFADDFLYIWLFQELFGWQIKPVYSYAILLVVLVLNGLLAYAVYRVMRKKPTTGREGMLGAKAVALTRVDVNGGWVKAHGERWQATSESAIEAGKRVVITEMGPGLQLRVQEKPHESTSF